jgi:hypothetical protein
LGFSDPANSGKKKILAGKKRHITTGKKKDTIVIHKHLKKNPKFFLGFQIPPIFCINHLVVAPSKRILNFFLGFQIPPIPEKKKYWREKKDTLRLEKKRYDS